jgi:Domain of unknown function (DUF4123)
LHSESELDVLASHLRRFHVAALPEGQSMLMRWYDTRILPVWYDALSPEQRDWFTGPIRKWQYVDRFGDLVELSQAGTSNAVDAQELQLSQKQLNTLLQAGETDALIAHLREVIGDELVRLTPRRLYPFVAEHLERAKRIGLDGMDDQTQFLLLALYTSGRFTEHPVIQALLQSRAQELKPFASHVEALPDSVWDTGLPLWHSVAE